MAIYTFGLLKTPLISPIVQMPVASQYFDYVANLKFMVNSMGPEEVLPLLHPQIYAVGDPNLNDQEFPPVSLHPNKLPSNLV